MKKTLFKLITLVAFASIQICSAVQGPAAKIASYKQELNRLNALKPAEKADAQSKYIDSLTKDELLNTANYVYLMHLSYNPDKGAYTRGAANLKRLPLRHDIIFLTMPNPPEKRAWIRSFYRTLFDKLVNKLDSYDELKFIIPTLQNATPAPTPAPLPKAVEDQALAWQKQVDDAEAPRAPGGPAASAVPAAAAAAASAAPAPARAIPAPAKVEKEKKEEKAESAQQIVDDFNNLINSLNDVDAVKLANHMYLFYLTTILQKMPHSIIFDPSYSLIRDVNDRGETLLKPLNLWQRILYSNKDVTGEPIVIQRGYDLNFNTPRYKPAQSAVALQYLKLYDQLYKTLGSKRWLAGEGTILFKGLVDDPKDKRKKIIGDIPAVTPEALSNLLPPAPAAAVAAPARP